MDLATKSESKDKKKLDTYANYRIFFNFSKKLLCLTQLGVLKLNN